MKEALTPECLDLQQNQIEDTNLEYLRNALETSTKDKDFPRDSGYLSELSGDQTDSVKSVNGKSSKLKIVKNKNKNGRIVIVMSKYMENGKPIQNGEETLLESETDTTNFTIGTTKHLDRKGFDKSERPKSGFMNDQSAMPLQTTTAENSQNHKQPNSQPLQLTIPNELKKDSQKRRHSDPISHLGQTKRFFDCRSISAPQTNSSQHTSKPTHVSGHQNSTPDFLNSCQDEPMDLSCSRVRETRNSVTETQINENSKPNEIKAADSPQESEPAAEFSPFLGNIIITDITANCLTVTFKEYVTV